jgi:hypothetical protein
MSGGHFSNNYSTLEWMAEEIEFFLQDESGDYDLPEDIVERIKETAYNLRRTAAMFKRIDYFISFDDGEESFRERWKEEVQKPWEETK